MLPEQGFLSQICLAESGTALGSRNKEENQSVKTSIMHLKRAKAVMKAEKKTEKRESRESEKEDLSASCDFLPGLPSSCEAGRDMIIIICNQPSLEKEHECGKKI